MLLTVLLIDPLGASTSLLARLFPLVYLGGLVALGLLVSFVLRRLATVAAFRQVHRWIPLLHLAVWLPLVWLLQHRLVSVATGADVWSHGLWLLVVVVAGLPWLRNLFLAVVFAVEARYKLGDDLRVGELEGRLVAVGLRTITLRGSDGADIAIPYERLLGGAVIRLNLPARPSGSDLSVSGSDFSAHEPGPGDAAEPARGGHDTPCALILDIPPGIAPARAAELARQSAALSRFASPRRPPEVFLAPQGRSVLALQLHVRGYLYDREHGQHFCSDLALRLHAAFAAELSAGPEHADRRPQ